MTISSPPAASLDNCNNKSNNYFTASSSRPLLVDLIKDIRRDVKGEDRNISIIIYTCLSAYTPDPINLALVSPSSEGKTYLVVHVLSRFPQEDVWMYRQVSPKTFTRERGVLAIRTIENNKESFQTKVRNEFTGETMSVAAYLNYLREAINEKKKKH